MQSQARMRGGAVKKLHNADVLERGGNRRAPEREVRKEILCRHECNCVWCVRRGGPIANIPVPSPCVCNIFQIGTSRIFKKSGEHPEHFLVEFH